MRIIVATNNAGKLEELHRLLPADVELISLAEAGLQSPDENGNTFVENALIKARHAAPHADGAIADDSGLVVDALDGAPGVRSARFAGPEATDAMNNQELLRRMAGVPRPDRRGRFVSAAAFVSRSGIERAVEGIVEGVILTARRGSNGFGYDPLFELADPAAEEFGGRTLAELDIEEKNAVSHRGRAIRALVTELRRDGLLRPVSNGNAQE